MKRSIALLFATVLAFAVSFPAAAQKTVTIAYQANFDTSVATIGQTTFALDRVNAVMMDYVEEEWRTFATRRIEPRLPLGRDWNLAIARQSSDMRRDLQCAVPMPAPPARSQMLVMTVCDKLKSQ